MERKITRGRQKIAIKRIERESDCFATFSKRRIGLYKKASELSTLCNVDIGVIVYSPTGKPFSFFHPTMESVVNRVQNPTRRVDDLTRLHEACTRARVAQLNEMLEKLGGELEMEKRLEKQLDDCVDKFSEIWEGPTEKFSKEQVENMVRWLENLKFELTRRKKELKR